MLIELTDDEARLLIRAASLIRIIDQEFSEREQVALKTFAGRLDLERSKNDSGERRKSYSTGG